VRHRGKEEVDRAGRVGVDVRRHGAGHPDAPLVAGEVVGVDDHRAVGPLDDVEPEEAETGRRGGAQGDVLDLAGDRHRPPGDTEAGRGEGLAHGPDPVADDVHLQVLPRPVDEVLHDQRSRRLGPVDEVRVRVHDLHAFSAMTAQRLDDLRRAVQALGNPGVVGGDESPRDRYTSGVQASVRQQLVLGGRAGGVRVQDARPLRRQRGRHGKRQLGV
jgi:hypothetical protein